MRAEARRVLVRVTRGGIVGNIGAEQEEVSLDRFHIMSALQKLFPNISFISIRNRLTECLVISFFFLMKTRKLTVFLKIINFF